MAVFSAMSGFQVLGDGAYGCQSVPGNTDGPGPRENVVPAVPDAVWH